MLSRLRLLLAGVGQGDRHAAAFGLGPVFGQRADMRKSFSSVHTGSTKMSGRSAPMLSTARRSARLMPPMVKLRPMSTVKCFSLVFGGAATSGAQTAPPSAADRRRASARAPQRSDKGCC